MGRKNNRKCIVCGEEFYYCSHNCTDSINMPSWYTIFHNENCHDIYDIVTNIYPNKGKEAAKQALNKCDLSNKKNFHKAIIKLIDEIYEIKENKKEEKVNIEENKESEIETESVKVKEDIHEDKIEINKEDNIEKSDSKENNNKEEINKENNFVSKTTQKKNHSKMSYNKKK